MTIHGHERVDNYYWLKERDNPEVIRYLEAENSYLEKSLSHLKDFRVTLYEEMKARYKKDEDSVPYKKGDYYYWSRYVKGQEYPLYCRRLGENGAEEVMLDANKLAEGHDFLQVGDMEISEDGKILAYSVDVIGRRQYTIYFKNLKTGETI